MGNFFTILDDKLSRFIESQQIFFTASSAKDSRVNVSPKGMDCFRIIDECTVAYLDLTGSGNETSAHILHDGNLTIMFCGFDSQCLIVRLYGKGEVILPRDPSFTLLAQHFQMLAGKRQIVMLHINSIQTSCGYGVPKFEFVAQRDTLRKWAEKQGSEAIKDYQQRENRMSIDGLPTHLGKCQRL